MDILADTNVIARRVQRTHAQYRQAVDATNRLSIQGHRFCVTSQNLIELWAISTRPIQNNGLGFSPAEADRVVAGVEAFVVRLPDSDDVYPEWRRLVSMYGVSGKKTHDARLVAAMKVNRVTHILTFNVIDFVRFDGIVVIDPAA